MKDLPPLEGLGSEEKDALIRERKTTFPVYAVYAHENDPPAGEDPLSWMLLTSEPVTTVEAALTILRWYGYRW